MCTSARLFSDWPAGPGIWPAGALLMPLDTAAGLRRVRGTPSGEHIFGKTTAGSVDNSRLALKLGGRGVDKTAVDSFAVGKEDVTYKYVQTHA